MEHPKKNPERCGDLKDPELPQIHSTFPGSPAEAMIRPAPLPLPPKEL